MQSDKSNKTPESPKSEDIKEFGAPLAQSPIHIVSIIGQIEGHLHLPQQNKATKYEHVLPQLVMIEQDASIRGFILLMNTVGGDVEAGLALAEMVAGMSKPSVSLVLGGGHSIGLTLAVSARHSYISPSASMTVHPIRMSGVIIGVPQTYDFLIRCSRGSWILCAAIHASARMDTEAYDADWRDGERLRHRACRQRSGGMRPYLRDRDLYAGYE